MDQRERYSQWKSAEERRDPSLPGSPEGRARIALCYPNHYSVGMANLGYQAVWSLLARHPHVHCDRVFLPEDEDLIPLKEGREDLLTLDNLLVARDSALLAFAISFESDYLNLLTLLRLLRFPLLRKERGGDYPPLLAGGIGPTLNPWALAPFFDVIYLGEFEPAAESLAEKTHALAMGEIEKEAFLDALAEEAGYFIPSRSKTHGAIPRRFEDFESRPAWSEILTPHSEFPHKVLIELERGCPFSCRFCAAGYAYGTSRRHGLESLKQIVDEALARFGGTDPTGSARSFGLIGGALTEYKWIVPLAKYIVEEKQARFSLSSMRLKRLDPELMALLAKTGQRQITVAPETGSERLRAVIKKNYSDAEVLESVRLAAEAGLTSVKLYSMVGLPTETDEDVEALANLARRCREVLVGACRTRGTRPGSVIISVGPFVPKPGTPFERAPFEKTEVLERRYKLLEKAIKKEPNTTLRTEAIRGAYLETFLSRLTEDDAPLLQKIHAALWEGRGIARVIKDFREEIDARVYAPRGEGPLPWEESRAPRAQDILRREWAAAQRGSVNVGG